MIKPNANNNIYFTIANFSLGYILVAYTNIGICAILMDDLKAPLKTDLSNRFRDANFIESEIKLKGLLSEIINFIEGKTQRINLKLDLRGTEFQKQVWNILYSIPSGATSTYTEIAKFLGKPKAYRAVANACAANPIAVIIPCHRVLRSDSAISGYRWGIERKAELLKREKQSYAK